jgi:hypothetical protein
MLGCHGDGKAASVKACKFITSNHCRLTYKKQEGPLLTLLHCPSKLYSKTASYSN